MVNVLLVFEYQTPTPTHTSLQSHTPAKLYKSLHGIRCQMQYFIWKVLISRVTHCWHSRAPIVDTAVPRENNEHGCVYLRCRALCKRPGCVEGHPWLFTMPFFVVIQFILCKQITISEHYLRYIHKNMFEICYAFPMTYDDRFARYRFF